MSISSQASPGARPRGWRSGPMRGGSWRWRSSGPHRLNAQKAATAGAARTARSSNDADRAAYLAAIDIPDAAARSALLPPPARGVDPAAVVRALRARLVEGTILTTDAGNFGGWAARHLPIPRHGRFLGPTSGAMGYALPAAIGAAVAMPDRPVLALAGDGGFAMLMAELETAVRSGTRLTAHRLRQRHVRDHPDAPGRSPPGADRGH